MTPWSTLRPVLLLFAVMGMLIAPVSTVAAEYAVTDMLVKASAQAEDIAGMMGNMPCCPDEQPVKPDCDKSCPFVIICSTSAPLVLLKADWTSATHLWTDHVYGVESFVRLRSLAAEPPARPPKT